MVPNISEKQRSSTATDAPLPEAEHNEYDAFTGHASCIVEPARKSDDSNFIWSLKQEPHFSRRMEILKKYPEVCCAGFIV